MFEQQAQLWRTYHPSDTRGSSSPALLVSITWSLAGFFTLLKHVFWVYYSSLVSVCIRKSPSSAIQINSWGIFVPSVCFGPSRTWLSVPSWSFFHLFPCFVLCFGVRRWRHCVCFRKQKLGFCGFVLRGDQLVSGICSTQRHQFEQNSSSWFSTWYLQCDAAVKAGLQQTGTRLRSVRFASGRVARLNVKPFRGIIRSQ